MFKHFFILLFGFVFSTTTFAQCGHNEVYKTAIKGGNAIYLRDFNKKIRKNSTNSVNFDLNKDVLYRFIHYNGLTSYIELKDKNNRLLRSSQFIDTIYPIFEFISPKKSTYKLIFHNKTDRKTCGVTILSYLNKKKSNFIGISSDTSLLASGKHLDFSCQYTDSFSSLSAYAKITEVLDISFNNFKVLPQEISNFKHLKKLSLSGNRYIDVNKAIKKLPNPEQLEVLDLSSLHFRKYPSELNRFTNLKALSFSDANFNSTLKIKNVFLLENLEILSLKNCRVKKLIVPELTNSSLKKMDLSGNRLKYYKIKNILQKLPKLEILCLAERDLRKFQIKRLQKKYPNIEIVHYLPM